MPRDGTKNLRDMSTRSKEEVKKIASKGGVNSGKARREKRTLKHLLEIAMEMTNEEGKTNAELITAALINKANDGSEKAYELIRDTLGEKPVDKIQNIEPPTFVFSEPKV